jgi:hypothetical protein
MPWTSPLPGSETLSIEDLPVALARDRWRSDASASKCTDCGRPFTLLLRRRHHCRRCGFVFCGDCTHARVHYVNLGDTARTCRLCRTLLVVSAQARRRGQGREREKEKEPHGGAGDATNRRQSTGEMASEAQQKPLQGAGGDRPRASSADKGGVGDGRADGRRWLGERTTWTFIDAVRVQNHITSQSFTPF